MSFAKKHPLGFWPVYQGKSFGLWNPDTGNYYAWANPEPVLQWLQAKRWRARNNSRSVHSEFSPEYLRDQETLPCFAPRVVFRDITSAVAQRTVIACLIPPRVFITNKGPYFLWPHGDERDQAFLLGILCSMPLDWYARRFVELGMNFYIINGFPIPRPARTDKSWKRVVELAGRLACPDKRFVKWAKAVGIRAGKLPEDEKEDMIHELDAVVAHLYGLKEKQLVHIYETFHENWDYHDRLAAVLRHFHRMRS